MHVRNACKFYSWTFLGVQNPGTYTAEWFKTMQELRAIHSCVLHIPSGLKVQLIKSVPREASMAGCNMQMHAR